MSLYLYLNNKNNVIDTLTMKIKEGELKIDALTKAQNGVQSIKHHKNITRKITTAIQEQGIYAAFNHDYSTPYISINIEPRIFKTTPPDKNGVSGSIYFESTSEQLHFSTYQELIDNINKRIEGIKELNIKLQNEIDNIDVIFDQLEQLQALYEQAQKEISYTLREAVNFK